jgi:hypothetical protein
MRFSRQQKKGNKIGSRLIRFYQEIGMQFNLRV